MSAFVPGVKPSRTVLSYSGSLYLMFYQLLRSVFELQILFRSPTGADHFFLLPLRSHRSVLASKKKFPVGTMAMQSVPFVLVPQQPSVAESRSQAAVAPRSTAGSAAFGVPGVAAVAGAVAAAAGTRKAVKPRKAARKAQSEKRFPVLSRSDPPLGKFPKMPESVHPGVVSGQALVDLLNHAKENGYAASLGVVFLG
eukprot:s5613_g1.t1